MCRPACSGRRCLTSSPLSSEGDKGGSRGGDSPEVTELEAARRPAAVLFPSPLSFWSPEHVPPPSIYSLLTGARSLARPPSFVEMPVHVPPPRQVALFSASGPSSPPGTAPPTTPRSLLDPPPPPSGSSAGVVGGPELPSRRSFSDWPDVRTTDGGEDAARPSGESRPRSRVRGTVGGLSKVNVVSVMGALSS